MQDQDKDADRSSDFWRERADEARAHVEHMASSDGKSWMLEIPRLYDRLADRAARREVRRNDKSQS